MYSRPLNKSPEKIVQNGKINFGSFQGVSDFLDIRGVKAPFAGIPIPKLFSNFRIKSKITYTFCYDKFAGLIEFFDDKTFGLAEVIVWNRETNQRYAYHTFMGPRRRFVPTNTTEASVTSFSKKRYIKISWNRKRGTLKLSFTLKGDKFRPAMKGKFVSPFTDDKSSETLFVNPAPTTQRCSATWFVPLSTNGGIGIAEHRKQITCLPESDGIGMMYVSRTYLKAHSTSEIAFGLLEQDGKKICFSFSCTSQDSLDDDNFNKNLLSVIDKTEKPKDSNVQANDKTYNTQTTAMPPVKITHPFGIGKNWIIQDTENMVDLTFTPLSVSTRTLNIILMRNNESTIYGTFEGNLLTKDGEKIALKNCPGIVKKTTLRL